MAVESITGRESDKVMLRLPDGMRASIAEEARKAGRSMNAEIVARLARSFSQPSPGDILDVIVDMRHDAASAELDRHMLVLMVQELAVYVKAFSHTLLSAGREPLSEEVRGKIAEWAADADELVTKASEMLHTDMSSAVEKFEETAKTLMDRSQRILAQAKTMMPTASPAVPIGWDGTIADATIIRREPKQPVLSRGPKPRKRVE